MVFLPPEPRRALAFTKRFGDLGITVLQQCSPETGKKLVALFNNGQLGQLKNPQAALEAIRQNGEPAGAWFCNNIGRLADPEALELWCRTPLEFVWDLKDLNQSAEELRASRKLVPPWLSTATAEWPLSYWVIGGVVLLVVMALFLKRRQPAPGTP